jgi:hypothetical protein
MITTQDREAGGVECVASVSACGGEGGGSSRVLFVHTSSLPLPPPPTHTHTDSSHRTQASFATESGAADEQVDGGDGYSSDEEEVVDGTHVVDGGGGRDLEVDQVAGSDVDTLNPFGRGDTLGGGGGSGSGVSKTPIALNDADALNPFGVGSGGTKTLGGGGARGGMADKVRDWEKPRPLPFFLPFLCFFSSFRDELDHAYIHLPTHSPLPHV